MEQKSKEWLKWRREGIGSSEAAAIMDVCPYNTKYMIWMDKLARSDKLVAGPHIDRGNHFEPKARAMFEMMSGDEYVPKLFVHDKHKFIRASLDGYCAEKNTLLEIKVPGLNVWNMVCKGQIPEHYMWQLEHQLMVSKADHAYFMCVKLKDNIKVYDNEIVDYKVLRYNSVRSSRERLLDEEIKFWKEYVLKKVRPDLKKMDIFVREYDTDEKIKKLWIELRDKKMIYDHLTRKLDEARVEMYQARDKITPLMEHERETAYGVQIFRNKNNGFDIRIKELYLKDNE